MKLISLSLFFILFGFEAFCFSSTMCTSYDSKEPPYPMTLRCQKVGEALYVDGGIDEFLYDEISLWEVPGYKVKGQKPLKKIFLNSRGGKMFSDSSYSYTAEQAVEIISEKKLETYVLKDKVCLSACVPIFVSGEVRKASPQSVFMVHNPRFSPSRLFKLKKDCGEKLDAPSCEDKIKELKLWQWKNLQKYFSLMEKFGVSPDLKKAYLSGEKDPEAPQNGNLIGLKDLYFSGLEAVKYKVALEN